MLSESEGTVAVESVVCAIVRGDSIFGGFVKLGWAVRVSLPCTVQLQDRFGQLVKLLDRVAAWRGRSSLSNAVATCAGVGGGLCEVARQKSGRALPRGGTRT